MINNSALNDKPGLGTFSLYNLNISVLRFSLFIYVYGLYYLGQGIAATFCSLHIYGI